MTGGIPSSFRCVAWHAPSFTDAAKTFRGLGSHKWPKSLPYRCIATNGAAAVSCTAPHCTARRHHLHPQQCARVPYSAAPCKQRLSWQLVCSGRRSPDNCHCAWQPRSVWHGARHCEVCKVLQSCRHPPWTALLMHAGLLCRHGRGPVRCLESQARGAK
jgi:hypothetical protein